MNLRKLYHNLLNRHARKLWVDKTIAPTAGYRWATSLSEAQDWLSANNVESLSVSEAFARPLSEWLMQMRQWGYNFWPYNWGLHVHMANGLTLTTISAASQW